MGNIAGIDLGTTYSTLAILNSIGKPQIVPNADGERLTPSAIYFDEDDAETIRVGIEAINSRYVNPDRVVRWVKRHMGESDYTKTIDGQDWSASELSSLILKKLKQDAEAEHGPIQDVVISVPAHFDEVRRKATMDAGTMIGLNVIGIVNEPVAAALHYATSNQVDGKVMVYDLGGGTFDITILDVKGHDMNIVCSQGDHALGGVDFDQILLEMLNKHYRETTSTELITSSEEQAKYEDEAEDIKKTLSRRKTAKKLLYGPAGSHKIEVTREMFENAISSLLARTDLLVKVALDEAKLKPSDIDHVLLVGGSSRIPAVHQRLEAMFGFPPQASVNVDECVALGAALHAGLTLLRQDPKAVPTGVASGLGDVKLTDVCNHSYGTICAPLDAETGERIVENRIILKKNTSLPCEQTQTFYTLYEGQRELTATITQGEDTDPEYVHIIGTQTFELPPNRPPQQPVEITYSYDINQRMHCRFKDVNSGKTLKVNFSMDGEGHILEKQETAEKAEHIGKLKVR